jgi:hypothetical protein
MKMKRERERADADASADELCPQSGYKDSAVAVTKLLGG